MMKAMKALWLHLCESINTSLSKIITLCLHPFIWEMANAQASKNQAQNSTPGDTGSSGLTTGKPLAYLPLLNTGVLGGTQFFLV